MKKDLSILLNELEALLREELAHYGTLMDLAKREQVALVKGQVNELREVTAGIEAATVSVRGCEERRVRLVEECREGLGLREEKPTLGQVIERLDARDASRFTALQTDLVAAMKEIHYLNENNASLVKHSLEYSNYLLTLFTGGRKSAVYDASGVVATEGNRKLLDQHA